MLRLVLINKNQDFVDYCYANSLTSDVIFICPNPIKADNVRQQFINDHNEINSITIAKFIKDGLRAAEKSIGKEIQYKGKSELILILGAIWKKLARGSEFKEFRRSFNLITEFRSYSTEEAILQTLLENYDQTMAESVLWFHRFINQLELVDEHKAYALYSQFAADGHIQQQKNLVFYGFDYFTGTQVDFLKILARKMDVIIPCYADLYDKRTNFDWVSWIADESVEVVDVQTLRPKEFLCLSHTYSKNYLGKTLDELVKKMPIDGIVLATPNLEQVYVQEIPMKNVKAKVKIDIFDEIFFDLFDELFEKNKAGMRQISLIIQFLDELKNRAILDENFRKLKIIFLLKEKINQLGELLSENVLLDTFDFNVIKEAVHLDLPRLNLTNISSEANHFVESLSGIENISHHKNIVFILSSFYKTPTTKGQVYTENVERYLSSVGPIRRVEYDLQLLKNKLLEFVWLNNVHFLIEKNFLEHNAKVNSLFREIKFANGDNLTLEKSSKTYPKLEVGAMPIKTLSATKLQRYIDCPRKYYLNYAQKFSPNVSIHGVLSSLDLGRIQHIVIETYFLKEKNFFNESVLDECVFMQLKSLFEVDSLQFRQYFVEIKSNTLQAIEFLIDLSVSLGTQINFEVPFSFEENGIRYNGSIDCVLIKENAVFIIDFKRSNYSFTSFSSLADFEQVQLWFYHKRLVDMGKISHENIGLGYLDLSEIENSMFVVNSEFTYNSLLNKNSDKNYAIRVKLIDNWNEATADYISFEQAIIEKLKNEVSFYPKPRRSFVCDHCVARQVCPRTNIGDLE